MATTVPKAPTLRVTSYTDTVVNVNADTNGNGGIPADLVQLGYGTNSKTPSTFKQLNLDTGVGSVTGLARGETYYFWVREHNSKGWSRWSNRVTIRMKSGPSAMARPLITEVTQQTVYLRLSPNFDGNSPITGFRVAYGTNASSPTDYIEWLPSFTRGVYHLNPGVTYYFWAQALNAYGASILSKSVSATLLAGSYVKVGAVRKRAVPYVNVAGSWKRAQPWVKVGGIWKQTK